MSSFTVEVSANSFTERHSVPAATAIEQQSGKRPTGFKLLSHGKTINGETTSVYEALFHE